MKRNALRMSLLAAAMAAAFGIARADTASSVTVPSDRLEPKCMDTANTQPAGCVPSAPIGSPSSSTDIDLNGSAAAKQYPGSPRPSSSTSSTLNVNPGVGVDAKAGVNNSNADIGADVGSGVNMKPDTGTSSPQ